MVAVEELLSAKKAHVKLSKRACATEVEKRQQLLAKLRKTSQAVTCYFKEIEESFQGLQPKVGASTAERNECRELATETAEDPEGSPVARSSTVVTL